MFSNKLNCIGFTIWHLQKILLYRDFLTACQCKGTGADVAGNT